MWWEDIRGSSIGGLQPISRDPKDNGVAAMLDDRTFYFAIQHGRHAIVFLDLQGLVENHLYEGHCYYGADGYLAGLKILIHDPDTPPMVDELGFAVGPGMSSFAAIRKQKVSQQTWACGRASESVSAREYGHGSHVSGLLGFINVLLLY